MKTAISIPDSVFAHAEALARRLRVSRSRLYATAIEAYLRLHADSDVTRRLDAVYAREAQGVDPVLDAMQRGSLPDEGW